MPASPARSRLASERRYQQTPNVLTRAVAVGVVVLARHATSPVVLEGTGEALWEALATSRTAGELIGELAARFQADPAAIALDVHPALHRLAELELLEVSE